MPLDGMRPAFGQRGDSGEPLTAGPPDRSEFGRRWTRHHSPACAR